MALPAMIGTQFMHYVVTITVVLLLFLLSVAYLRQGIRSAHCLLAAAGLLLAWMAQRNGILFTMLILPGLLWNAGAVHACARNGILKFGGILAIVLAASSAVTAAINHTRMLSSWPQVLSPFSYPVKTAALLEKMPATGNLFNADRYGGYLLWKLYPQWKVSSDTRLTMRSAGFYREYLDLAEHPEKFDAYADKWNITRVVLPVAPLTLYLPLATALYHGSRWHCIFTDGTEVLFSADERDGAAVDLRQRSTIDSLLVRLRERYPRSPAVLDEAKEWLGRWCLAVGVPEGAGRILRASRNASGKIMLATAEEQAGEPDAAEKLLRSVCENAPRNSDARFALAMFYLRNGRREEGVRQLGILLKKDPFNARARNVLYILSGNKKEKQ